MSAESSAHDLVPDRRGLRLYHGDSEDDPHQAHAMEIVVARPGVLRLVLRKDPVAGSAPLPGGLAPDSFVWAGVGYVWIQEA